MHRNRSAKWFDWFVLLVLRHKMYQMKFGACNTSNWHSIREYILHCMSHYSTFNWHGAAHFTVVWHKKWHEFDYRSIFKWLRYASVQMMIDRSVRGNKEQLMQSDIEWYNYCMRLICSAGFKWLIKVELRRQLEGKTSLKSLRAHCDYKSVH